VQTVGSLKDVALVEGLFAVSQQIKNIVFSTRSDRPFSPQSGPDLNNIDWSSSFFRMLGVQKIYDSIKYGNKFLQNVKINSSVQNTKLKLTISFDYVVGAVTQPNNVITLEKSIL
jgi:hypothetical protein